MEEEEDFFPLFSVLGAAKNMRGEGESKEN
jgi:hypothetical protein